ncbi:MAG: hypothetical protein KKD25_03710 [Gammaproteobacteria bacterium]|uniref:Uncharacterized protein n=1 Tax=viral metagenome TaxID=1070528 RepID=A0A6M3LX39_9ZZZZ|nr:hypothetical protein [Gammaproteobacteria bacterium]MBU0770965.1 hypothetical protein [Gammaproteobacteria bacterium]MBU0856719.1 hypothetical protein [Gammaproteobacteria bacterium]MBU1848068.1 hypothetical protein [Gammaproteobacteria bacterium]
MKIGRCEFTFDADGKGGSTWWQKALLVLAIPFLLVYLLLDALLEAPGKLGMWLCNTLGRAGLPEIGGGLLQLRYPRRRIDWRPEGDDPEKLASLESKGIDVSALRKPHFACIHVVKIRKEKRNGRE